jgi:acyl-CoA thioesterase-1
MLRRLFLQMVPLALAVNTIGLSAIAVRADTPRPRIRLVAFGDSLTAGFGLAPSEAFPVVLEQRLRALGHDIVVENAGVSGDTTSGGLARLDWAVPEGTDAVILELGANDMLTGQSHERARTNLDRILERLKARNIDVLVAGMRASRSLGAEYADAFDRIYPELATKHGTLLYPFFLDGVALDPRLNLPDGIHPTAEGVRVIAERILPSVEKLLTRVETRRKRTAG